jgi:hypothetical protein
MVRGFPTAGTQIGGCGCWIGRGQMFTKGYREYFPFQAKGSVADQAFSTRSRLS